jgi:hypothetical protein
MAQWISSNNVQTGNGQLTNYVRAYTKVPSPVAVPSSIAGSSGYIPSGTEWGAGRVGPDTYVPIPPTLDASVTNRWTLTLSQPQFIMPPPYFLTTANFVCEHTDSVASYHIKDRLPNAFTGVNNGTDIVFSDMTWINAGRGVIEGAPNAQIINSRIVRDTTTYAGGQLPCFSSESGGPQFSQANDINAPTYGNQLTNFTAVATADDSAAFYNDVSGTSKCTPAPCPQSNVTTSSFTNADEHALRLYNDASVTSIADIGTPTLLDTGSCPTLPPPLNGSPVCVDSTTTTIISSSAANCDTYRWDTSAGNGCPVYYPYNGYMGGTEAAQTKMAAVATTKHRPAHAAKGHK